MVPSIIRRLANSAIDTALQTFWLAVISGFIASGFLIYRHFAGLNPRWIDGATGALIASAFIAFVTVVLVFVQDLRRDISGLEPSRLPIRVQSEEPNIVCTHVISDAGIDDPWDTNKTLDDYNGVWVPNPFICRSVLARFHNQPLSDVLIRAVGNVTASIFYSNDKGEQLHIVKAVWQRDANGSHLTNHVSFKPDSVRELILAMRGEEGTFFTLEDLTDDDQWPYGVRRVAFPQEDLFNARVQFRIDGRADKREYRFTLLLDSETASDPANDLCFQDGDGKGVPV